ncbi:DUF2953 domain-containing protein [Virgibacillus necropolis]|uniref:DUF2953 domain-containing protein n=1 Tax=Virgibacillus necropolis TaxID=163877 RepID=A0A221MBG8_9BACI|nr:DUF2953 domain-containing protein [Virgibacillus necropolis]ASN04981.1 hypothetical protein CFK40_08135 [Virgibacillus necropolis]
MVWLIIIIFALIIVLLFSKIYVTVNFSYVSNKQNGSIDVYFLKIPLYRKNIQSDESKKHSILELVNNDNRLSDLIEDGKFFIKMMKESIPSIFSLLKKIAIHKFNWHTNVGAGEASSTGMVSGGVWSVKGFVLALIRETSQVVCPLQINVQPCFQQTVLNTQINMKVSIRLGQAILGGARILRTVSKLEKNKINLRERKI